MTITVELKQKDLERLQSGGSIEIEERGVTVWIQLERTERRPEAPVRRLGGGRGEQPDE